MVEVAPDRSAISAISAIGAVTEVDVLVIGAGQAGLSAAYHLARGGVDHLVVDGETGPGGAWRHRWPSLTMAGVNGIRELPGFDVPDADPETPAKVAVPDYFSTYEQRFGLRIRRPISIHRVLDAADGSGALIAEATTGERFRTRALINATGTWTQPYWPYYAGATTFLGSQWHTHDYPGPAPFRDRRAVVIGAGISALQLLLEIAPVTAAHTWVSRRPPDWRPGEFTAELGRRAVAQVADRVRRGLPPQSVVSVTGLPVTPAIRQALDDGTLHREEMFAHITPDGVAWTDGRTRSADILLWCTGFRPALGHLAPLHLRAPGGGIALDGTRAVRDHRVHLIGYGPSASTIGANRAGRSAVAEIRQLLSGG